MRIPSLLVVVVLGGCSGIELTPLSAPVPGQVVAYAEEMSVVAKQDMSAREYVGASIVYSEQKCEEFFNALSRFRQDAKMFDKVLIAAAAAGTPLYPIFKISQTAQTVFSTSITAGQTVTASYGEIYAFTPYAEELRVLVKDAQASYLASEVSGFVRAIDDKRAPLSLASKGSELTQREAYLYARYVANGYAAQCSLSNLHALIRQSIIKARISNPGAADLGRNPRVLGADEDEPTTNGGTKPAAGGGKRQK
jgi:hypothetical protein